jgi:proline iminopeptidase
MRDKDTEAAMKDNDTPHLISDIEKLRDELGIRGKMHILGGSWGSTLALAYAIDHPEHVQTLILRGIFLCRQKDLDYFYQGNAATYPNDTTLAGAYMRYPEAWKEFVEVIPAGEKRKDMVKAYAEIFEHTPTSEPERKYLERALLAWAHWEGVTSYVSQRPDVPTDLDDPEVARGFSRVENHYFMNGCFLGGKGEKNRDNNYLLENIHKIKNIPIHIVQGQFDEVCPRFQADELVDALVKTGKKREDIDYRLTPAGHSREERDNAAAQIDIMDHLPKMKQADKVPVKGLHGRAAG